MPRGFLVKRWHHEDSLRYRDADEDLQQHSMGLFHPALQYYDPVYSSSPYSNPNPLHTLAERLGFEPHPLYLYAEPMELSTPPPLDLSIKATPITPPATPSPSSPVRKRQHTGPEPVNVTPRTPVTKYDPAKKHTSTTPKTPLKKTKAVRRLNFDEDKSSPVSGTIIRELRDDEEPLVVRKGDIDPAFNVVEVTEEAKAELAKIENRIGDYICRLCKEMYEDAFSLAQHRCSRIVHVEYRCPECDKVFNCPANLASHRRWHKPRPPPMDASTPAPTPLQEEDADSASEETTTTLYPCPVCQKQFRRQAYLRKHLAVHQSSEENLREEKTIHPRPFEGLFYPPLPLLRRPTSPLSLIATPNERLGLGMHQHQVTAN